MERCRLKGSVVGGDRRENQGGTEFMVPLEYCRKSKAKDFSTGSITSKVVEITGSKSLNTMVCGVEGKHKEKSIHALSWRKGGRNRQARNRLDEQEHCQPWVEKMKQISKIEGIQSASCKANQGCNASARFHLIPSKII